MWFFRLIIFLFLSLSGSFVYPQEVINKTLIVADKLYINHQYEESVQHYIKYLADYPRDYYASRQAAICYNRLNDPGNAIDYWPIVVESSDASEKDYLELGRSLLANDRGPEAIKVFRFLSKSKDKSIAAWGKAYLNPMTTVTDTVNTKIIELVGVNTDLSESSPLLFMDKLFFVSDPTPPVRNFIALTNLPEQSVKVSVKKDSLQFIPSLLYEKIQLLNLHGQFCFSPDGRWMYFTKALSNKELNTRSDYPFFKYQMFMLDMNTLVNYVPEIIPFKHNLPGYDFMHPCMSRDGKRLYFASNMKGSMGGKDLYVCEWQNNEWAPPRNLGPNVNTSGNEIFPQITEENGLYFSSDHWPGHGGLDIFYAKPSSNQDELFNPATNVGQPMNGRFDDFGLFILGDGKNGYLSSNRKNITNDDIYFFSKR